MFIYGEQLVSLFGYKIAIKIAVIVFTGVPCQCDKHTVIKRSCVYNGPVLLSEILIDEGNPTS